MNIQPDANLSMTDAKLDAAGLIKQKILHILSIYPYLSPTMLSIGIGTAIPGSFRQAVIESMRDEGLIKIEHRVGETPGGRWQTYTLISLAATK